tara:strand:+ start:1163 stop:1897 length:735 start_codon:yes stop_codon:yes gene_type:complete
VRVHRVYCKSVSGTDSGFDLDQTQSIHLSKVLRLKLHEEVEAFDGMGSSAICKITDIEKRSVSLQRVSEIQTSDLIKEKIICVIPLIKKDNFHFMIQKLTEIGVSDFIFYKPDLIDQSIAKKDITKVVTKSEEVIISACKQCGSNFMPTSTIHENITKAFNFIEEGIDIYVFDVEASEGFNLNKLKSGKNICLVTGPESGFSESELDFFKNRDIKLRLIGNNILRAETAPIVISSLVQNHFGKI